MPTVDAKAHCDIFAHPEMFCPMDIAILGFYIQVREWKPAWFAIMKHKLLSGAAV